MAGKAKQNFSKVSGAVNDNLPRWNFSNFYPEVDSPEFKADLSKLEKQAADFVSQYQGKVAGLSGAKLGKAIQQYKDTSALLGKLHTYVSLKNVQDSNKYGAALVSFENKIAPIISQMAFFEHEIRELTEKDIQKNLKKSAALRKFEPWLDRQRRAIPHTPPLDVQQYMGELSAQSGWHKLFDDRHVAKRYEFEGEELTQTELLKILSSDHDQARRAAAQDVFEQGMKEDVWLFTAIHNELMRLKSVEDRWEKFDKPWEARHFSNNVAPQVVDALEKAVKDSYARIPHRFYALKAKLMGQEKLNIYDRNVNIFEDKTEKYIPFADAKKMVLDAYRQFSPDMADEAQKFFDKGWIDAPVGKYKQAGAFAAPGAAQLENPMVMLNYQGSPRDVATMAHELGHGVHQSLAAHKGDAIVSTPLTLAETASVFGEMLTFKSLLAQAANDDERRKLLFEKVNDMINTVFRQISFYDFEKRIHSAYKEKGGPLSEEEICRHWIESAQESFGSALPVEESYGPVFGYIPHIVHTPFYVYAYAFGDALVNALYRVYEEGTVPDFEKKYIEMLEAGGTLKPEDLKDKFGLDISDPAFWDKGLQVTEDLLDELETLCQPLLQQQPKPQTAAPGPTRP